MATVSKGLLEAINELEDSFQSIGVTKEWRHPDVIFAHNKDLGEFPINRRHQRMATLLPVPAKLLVGTKSFQSIGVTKEWRHILAYEFITEVWSFPINRRHQRMATCWVCLKRMSSTKTGFQSIGVTKEWRQGQAWQSAERWPQPFPINRRHQRMATVQLMTFGGWSSLFPINRRHQRMATYFLF